MKNEEMSMNLKDFRNEELDPNDIDVYYVWDEGWKRDRDVGQKG
jgi:hypothetical protein